VFQTITTALSTNASVFPNIHICHACFGATHRPNLSTSNTASTPVDPNKIISFPTAYNAIVTQGVTNSENSTVHVASGTSVSFLRHYYEKETKRIYPHLTAIIDVNDGVSTGWMIS